MLVFLVAVKEMMGNIHKRLSTIYGIAAVISSTVGHWAKRVRDVEVRKTQLLDFSQSARQVMVTIFWNCKGLILLEVIQRGMTVYIFKCGHVLYPTDCTYFWIYGTRIKCQYIDIKLYQHAEKMRKCFQYVWHDKNLYEILLQHNSTRSHTSVKTQEAITQLDGWSYLIHPTALT